MVNIGLGLRAERASDNCVTVYQGDRRLGWAHLTVTCSPMLCPGLRAVVDEIGLCPGDVCAAIAGHFDPVVYPGDLPEGEPWDAPHRTREESFELLRRLERRAKETTR